MLKANKMSPLQAQASILYQERLGQDYRKLGLALPELGHLVRPGQFVMIKPTKGFPRLLRRPLSVHNRLVENNRPSGIELLYKVVGEGTQAMSHLTSGDKIDVLGPLGNGFWHVEGMKNVYLVAGGVGVASLHFLAAELAALGNVSLTLFLGGCSASDILCRGQFDAMGASVVVTTEDCSLGNMGLVTSQLEKTLEQGERPDVIYSCGPKGMLDAVGRIAAAHNVVCQVSLESLMACGFGVCLGCAVPKAKVPGTYVHVCSDGPVFDANDFV